MFNSTLIVETRPILSHFLQIIGLVGTGGFFLPIDVQFNTDCLDKTNFVTFFADDWACCGFAAVAIAKSFEVFTPEVCFTAIHIIWNSTVVVAIDSLIQKANLTDCQIPRFSTLVLSPTVYILAAKGVTLRSLYQKKESDSPLEGSAE